MPREGTTMMPHVRQGPDDKEECDSHFMMSHVHLTGSTFHSNHFVCFTFHFSYFLFPSSLRCRLVSMITLYCISHSRYVRTYKWRNGQSTHVLNYCESLSSFLSLSPSHKCSLTHIFTQTPSPALSLIFLVLSHKHILHFSLPLSIYTHTQMRTHTLSLTISPSLLLLLSLSHTFLLHYLLIHFWHLYLLFSLYLFYLSHRVGLSSMLSLRQRRREMIS